MQDIQDILVDCDVISYAWLPTEYMWADILTKEMKLSVRLELALESNTLYMLL